MEVPLLLWINNIIQDTDGVLWMTTSNTAFSFTSSPEGIPEYINTSLKEGIEYFGTKIKGFNNDDAILAAVESRTSSPIRIIRDKYFESNIKGIYPCGEGAGYAGGIMSAAADGVRCAEAAVRYMTAII